jgi:hypothetical protein
VEGAVTSVLMHRIKNTEPKGAKGEEGEERGGVFSNFPLCR